MTDGDTDTVTTTPFRDAEAFLDQLGVERRPIQVVLPDAEGDDGRAPVSAAEANRLAQEAPPLPELDDTAEAALALVRRSTGAAPASEGRMQRKLAERGYEEDVIESAMAHARAQRLVDDDALAAALVAEWRAQGHAPRKLRDSLRKREFDEDVVQRAVAAAEEQDPLAVAFELAQERAARLRDVPAETAYRRVAAYVARRGHSEGVARKAARDAVFTDREDDQITGR